jgi:hypothetical protein
MTWRCPFRHSREPGNPGDPNKNLATLNFAVAEQQKADYVSPVLKQRLLVDGLMHKDR